MGSKLGGGVQGFKYYLSLFMGLCRGPIDEIVQINVGDLTAWSGSITDTGSITINAPNLFGGDTKEGGIDGTSAVYFGKDDQLLSSQDQASLNSAGLYQIDDDGNPVVPPGLDPTIVPAGAGLVPGFRGVATLFYRGLVSANSPYLKVWKVRTRRSTKGWDGACWQPDKVKILMASGQNGADPTAPDIVAMNPAHILYECASNGVWGRGLDRAAIDDDAWLLAAETLYNEGFGLCLRWNRQDTLTSFVQSVIDHINGSVFTDRRTGLLTLKLVRGDYSASTLPLYDADSGLLAIEEDDSGSPATQVNEVIVKWRDPILDENRQARAQNIAMLQSNDGAFNSQTVEYAGIPTASLAARVAARDLMIQGANLKRFVISLDRRGWRIGPASVFRISDPSRGITEMVMRAAKIEDGTAGGHDGTIKVTAVQDIFGMPDTGLTGIQPVLWFPPVNTPIAPYRRSVVEMGYRDCIVNLSSAELAALDATSGVISTLAGKTNLTSPGYEIASKTGSEAYAVRTTYAPWCATARLSANVGVYDTSFTIDRMQDIADAEVGGAILIGNEWMRLNTLNTSTGAVTVGRGCVDTVPIAHTAGEYVFFADGRESSDRREYVTGEVVDVKMLTQTTTDVLDIGSAAVDAVTMAQRHFRAYPPGNVRVDGTPALSPIPTTSADRVITWKHRDRLSQLDDLVDHNAGDIGPEAGTTYTLRFYDSSNVLQRTAVGITGNSFTYTTAMQSADEAGGLYVNVNLQAVRDSLPSFTSYTFIIYLRLIGWDEVWGFAWG